MENGARWVGAGTNLYFWSYGPDSQMSAVSSWEQANGPAIADELAGLGCNFVAIPVNEDRSAPYVSALKGFTDAFAAQGIRSVLRPFGGLPWAPGARSGNLAADLWVALGRPVHVLLDTVNEPNPGAYSDTPAAWEAGTRAAIQAMRAKGYTQPVFCDGRGWAWTLPVAEARRLAAEDPQLVFMSHRYAFTGSSFLGSSDAGVWAAEWLQTPDLCVGVGEYGWFNQNGRTSSIDEWCKPMADAHVQGVADGWLSVVHAWMFLWDANSHITATAPPPGEPGSSNRDWYAISRGAPYTWNAWGQVVRDEWARIAALRTVGT
jgi:hypothetical protein